MKKTSKARGFLDEYHKWIEEKKTLNTIKPHYQETNNNLKLCEQQLENAKRSSHNDDPHKKGIFICKLLNLTSNAYG